MKSRLLAIILALVVQAKAYEDEPEAVVENAEDVTDYAAGDAHGSIQVEDADYGRVELDSKEKKMLPILAKLQKKYEGLSEKERQKLVEKADGYREKFSNVLMKIDEHTSKEFGLDVKLLHKILGLERDTIDQYETMHEDDGNDYGQEEIKEETDYNVEQSHEGYAENVIPRKAVPEYGQTEAEYLRPMESDEEEYEDVLEHEYDTHGVPHLDDLQDQPVYVEDEDEFYKLYRKHLKSQERRLVEKQRRFWSGEDPALELYRVTGRPIGSKIPADPHMDEFFDDYLYLGSRHQLQDVYDPVRVAAAPVQVHRGHHGGRRRQGKSAARLKDQYADYAVLNDYVGHGRDLLLEDLHAHPDDYYYREFNYW